MAARMFRAITQREQSVAPVNSEPQPAAAATAAAKIDNLSVQNVRLSAILVPIQSLPLPFH